MDVLDKVEQYLCKELLDLNSIKTGNDYNRGRYRMILDMLVEVTNIRYQYEQQSQSEDDKANEDNDY